MRSGRIHGRQLFFSSTRHARTLKLATSTFALSRQTQKPKSLPKSRVFFRRGFRQGFVHGGHSIIHIALELPVTVMCTTVYSASSTKYILTKGWQEVFKIVWWMEENVKCKISNILSSIENYDKLSNWISSMNL